MNRPVFFALISIRATGKHHFFIWIPLPLFLLLMLSGMARDFRSLAGLFKKHSPGKTKKVRKMPIAGILWGLEIMDSLVSQLIFHCGPMDICNIGITDSDGNLKVNILLR